MITNNMQKEGIRIFYTNSHIDSNRKALNSQNLYINYYHFGVDTK